ncbi:hypothetical protein OG500_01985 [Kitasatospora sp. NBC_01250]|uniref:hypothetical protein n=1 Tax=unclassified Kitasatospora TaxID=2633591 RepID=UPI002E157A96|nr:MULTISPECIES: hypothetical protein [unclassified Kitasatospora]WSJ64955.1 hypothetical protein OG294_01915 [Kitasatospora sp. NBC_01302]
MPDTMALTDLDALISDLDERITETTLPTPEASSGECSGLCTVACATVLICSGIIGVC